MAGAIIVTGPSSCGKGEISKALCERLAIPAERWLSMGTILRAVCEGTCDDTFIAELEARHAISDVVPIFATTDITEALSEKIERHKSGLTKMFAARSGRRMRPAGWRTTTALDWLEYCTSHGLLVPNRWTQELIATRIAEVAQPPSGSLIFDGYPRTPSAAKHLLDTLESLAIPVWKVLHLSISKQEMLHRAVLRRRGDDDANALLKRYEFYVDSVQPSVDYMKDRLGSGSVALIDAHQPSYDMKDGARVLNLARSIGNVVRASLAALAVA
ncbi:MAG: nucleoside monophosphate kinase [Micropepsaceae bacterium]